MPSDLCFDRSRRSRSDVPRMSLYSSRDLAHEESSVSRATQRAFRWTARWREGGDALWVSADVGSPGLHRIMLSGKWIGEDGAGRCRLSTRWYQPQPPEGGLLGDGPASPLGVWARALGLEVREAIMSTTTETVRSRTHTVISTTVGHCGDFGLCGSPARLRIGSRWKGESGVLVLVRCCGVVGSGSAPAK